MKKKTILLFSVCIVMITIIVQSFITSYCLDNVFISVNARAREEAYPQYEDKILGAAGLIRNSTIFPIKIISIRPVDGRGVEYIATKSTEWGFSEISEDELSKLENIDDKIVDPLTESNVGYFYKFTGEYMVNPEVFEVTYSVFGIKFKQIKVSI